MSVIASTFGLHKANLPELLQDVMSEWRHAGGTTNKLHKHRQDFEKRLALNIATKYSINKP
jgi:hypothetical protein